MRLTLRRRILRAGLIRAQAILTAPWHPKVERAKAAKPRLVRRLGEHGSV